MNMTKLCKLVKKLQEASDLLDEIRLPAEENAILCGKLYTVSTLARSLKTKYVGRQPRQMYALKESSEGIATDDFLDELFEGFIEPGDFLCDPEPVEQAVKVIKDFIEALEEQGMLEWI